MYCHQKTIALRIIFLILTFSNLSYSDSFNYNTYNNHGVVGIINMPSARLYDESIHGLHFTMALPIKR